MELKKTQIEVLKTLAQHENEWLGTSDIQRYSSVKNTGHIVSAIKFFMQNDLVYQPNFEDKVQITPDGLNVISAYI